MQRLARHWLFAAGCVLSVVFAFIAGHLIRKWVDNAPIRHNYIPLLPPPTVLGLQRPRKDDTDPH